MLHNPASHPWPYPEPEDAERDQHQEEPLDVMAEEASAGAVEPQSASVDNRVLSLSPVEHGDGPGQGYPECDDGEQSGTKADKKE